MIGEGGEGGEGEEEEVEEEEEEEEEVSAEKTSDEIGLEVAGVDAVSVGVDGREGGEVGGMTPAALSISMALFIACSEIPNVASILTFLYHSSAHSRFMWNFSVIVFNILSFSSS